MGNYILNHDVTLLRINNAAMRFFYENLIETAEVDKFYENSEIAEFVSMLDQETYGCGTIFIELSKTVHSPQMLKLLQQLIEKTVEKIKNEKQCIQESIDRFEEFQRTFSALTFEDLSKNKLSVDN